MIRLDEQKNVYVHGHNEYDRLTTVLESVGIIDATWYTEFAAQRGTYVHKACALFDQGILDWKTVDPVIEGYVLAWAKFRKDSASRFKNLHIEKTLFHEGIKIAGTLDRIESEENSPSILDIKTGDCAFVGVQTAGYLSLLRNSNLYDLKMENMPLNYRRYAVKLNANSTYKLKLLNNPADISLWQSAVNIYRWRNPK